MPTQQTITTFLNATNYNNVSQGTIEFLNDGSAILYPDITTLFYIATMTPAETLLFIAYPFLFLTPIPDKYQTQRYYWGGL